MLQAKGIKLIDAKYIQLLKELYQLPVSKIVYSTEKSETEVLKEESTKESLVVYLFNQGYVSLINQTFYVFNQSVGSSAIFSNKLLVEKDYQLDKDNIIKEIEEGKIVNNNGQLMIYWHERSNLIILNKYQLKEIITICLDKSFLFS